ncbi:hypothetical protein Y032_0165g48 [Ancylostoma ceylanicum]|uniref:von Willebrand factor type A domain protein n=1 Tax=Ancylostoma ceylanicum TaxID=53326 RepID=A0A016SX02_9BILA|nr:hypothetical protein Y032_0165g48 [Ancylostoma ceylanicum]
MSFDRYCSILLLTFVTTGYSYEDTNELAKVCRPVALRLNVLFLLDGSGSVSGATFAMQMKMLNKIANMMNIGRNESQIAVLQYAGFTRLEFGFSDHQSLDDLLNSLRRIRHMSGTTKTGKAMLKALELFQKAKHAEEQDVSQVAVVVTDGHSHDNPLPAAEALRAAGVTILTLGIGEHINRDEIVRISGKDELAFQDLHRNISLENFVAGFKNLSQGEHCEYARGSDGAQITCGPDFIQVEVSTNHKLKGRLFFEGFHGEPGCSSTDDSSRLDPQHARYDVRIRALHGKCGLVRSHEANSRGFMVTSRAVLQFDRRFATVNDHSFEIRCFYADKRKKAKTPRRAEGITTLVQDAIGTSLTENSPNTSDRMTCTYEVAPQLEQCSSSGISVGTMLRHRWSCDRAHGKFVVHSCYIVDPVTHRTEVIVDENGCVVEKSIITALTYSTDGTVTALGRAVRFTDAPLVKFSCRLRLCNEGNDNCHSSFPPQCRSKRAISESEDVTFPTRVEPFTREYDDSAAYDDDVEALLPDPEPATMKMMKEATPPSQSESSTFSITPIKRVSSIAPLFPPGGVDVTLNSKSVAIVRTDHARDRFKQALQLRAGAAQSPALITAEIIPRGGAIPVEIHHMPNQGGPVLVTASLRSGPHPSNLVLKQVKGFVKQSPSSQDFHEDLRELPLTTKPSTEIQSSTAVSTEQPHVEEATRSTQQTSHFPSTATTQLHTTTSRTILPIATMVEIVESSSLDDFEEEVVVTSDPLVVRLPHEKFVTGCPRSVQC